MSAIATENEGWPSTSWFPSADTQAGESVDVSNFDETLDFLRCFDTLFLVDDSAHMAPYWRDVQAVLERIVPLCAKHDADGVDVYFVNHRPKKMMGLLKGKSARKSGYRGLGSWHSKDSVASIFAKVKPAGACTLGSRLSHLLNWYAQLLRSGEENAALNMIVITAGIFDDDVRAPLVKVARDLDHMRMPEHQVGIQLFQIGDQNNPAVQRNLAYLDDELHQETGTRDIVDTTSWDGSSLQGDNLLKVILGAVVKKLDERRSALHLDKSVPAVRADNDYE